MGFECGCDMCVNIRIAERMAAATCKCGHVGAECFNDSYCKDVPSKPGFVHDDYCQPCLERALMDAKYWENREAHTSAEWRAACQSREDKIRDLNRLYNDLNERETNILKLCQKKQETIDELSHTCDAWRDNYAALEESMCQSDLEHEDRVAELETTIRVLAGLLNG